MIIDARLETGYTIGQEFITLTKGGDSQVHIVAGFRDEFVFLIEDGKKDGKSELVISQRADAMVYRHVIDGRPIIDQASPLDRIRALSIAREIVTPAPAFTDGLRRVEIGELEPGSQYRLMGRQLDGRVQLGGRFVEAQVARNALAFDLGMKERSGLLQLVGARNGVSTLQIEKGVLSLPTHLVTCSVQVPGVTIWRPVGVAS